MKLFTGFCVNENGVKCNNPSCWDVVDTESGRQMVSFCKKDSPVEATEEPPAVDEVFEPEPETIVALTLEPINELPVTPEVEITKPTDAKNATTETPKKATEVK